MNVGNEIRPSGLFEKRNWIACVACAIVFIYISLYLQDEKNAYFSQAKEGAGCAKETSEKKNRACVPPSIKQFPNDLFTQEERQRGYVLLHICITAYLCLILAIVCDQYFVPSLEVISTYMKVPVDVAGATFMAIGTSSPEMYSAVIGSFVTEGDIGIGTIVGSAVFNILGVTSVTGLLLWRTEAPVDWYPVSRDCIVYISSVAALIYIIQDNSVTWFESSFLILMFVMYIILMIFNHNIRESCTEKMEDLNTWWKRYRKARSHSIRIHKGRSRSTSSKTFSESNAFLSAERILSEEGNNSTKAEESDSEDDMSPWNAPSDNRFQLILWLITWPALVLITSTIPNCRKPKEGRYPLTFFASVIWIGILSYLCSWMVTIIGYTFGLPDSVAGITLLAAGISVPEVIASVIVVKSGMANMAFSNLIGSNIFDILFCLGLPWFFKTWVFSPNGQLTVHSSALAYSAMTLLLTVVLLFLTLSAAGWKLNWRVGLCCLGLYMLFLIVACMFEMNVFGNMNPPTCVA